MGNGIEYFPRMSKIENGKRTTVVRISQSGIDTSKSYWRAKWRYFIFTVDLELSSCKCPILVSLRGSELSDGLLAPTTVAGGGVAGAATGAVAGAAAGAVAGAT